MRKILIYTQKNRSFFVALSILIGSIVIIFSSFWSLIRLPKKSLIEPTGHQYTALPARRFQTYNSSLNPTVTVTSQNNPPVLGVEDSRDSRRIPIIYYHYIEVNPNPKDTIRTGLSVSPALFDTEMKFLYTNGYTTITLDEMAAAFAGKFILPAKPIILTFDDGYADFYTNAYSILGKYNLKAVLFIPTGLIGNRNYLTWEQIKEMQNSGRVFYGAHSVHHAYLPKLAGKRLDEEVAGSKKDLESHLGAVINWFAYPYGSYDANVIAAVRRAGFIGAATTIKGSWQSPNNFYSLKRIRVGSNISLATFSSLVGTP